MPNRRGPSKVPRARTLAVRIPEATIAQAEAIAACLAGVSSLSKLLGRAVELGMPALEREFASALQGKANSNNGVGERADVGTEEA